MTMVDQYNEYVASANIKIISSFFEGGITKIGCQITVNRDSVNLKEMAFSMKVLNAGNDFIYAGKKIINGGAIDFTCDPIIKDDKIFLELNLYSEEDVSPFVSELKLIATWIQSSPYKQTSMQLNPISYKNINYGQLVQCQTPSGRITAAKVHFFNTKGALLGNMYEFVEYDRLFLHDKGEIYEQKYYKKPMGAIRQKIYEMACGITSVLIRMTQEI
jgi:hypothetical protein